MLRSIRPLALLAALAAHAAAFAPTAGAQIMTNYSFKPPAKVQEAMERDKVPGIFYFTIPGEIPSHSVDWNFTQPMVVDLLTKHKFACCKIAVTDVKSTRPWGSYQKLADEFGVTPCTTVVFVSYDRKVLGLLSQVIKRDEFLPFLRQKAAENSKRFKDSEDANGDLTQVEKWMEEKRYADAGRRLKNVLGKGERIADKVMERAKELDGKFETAGNERLAEGKRLVDAGKGEEAKPILEEVINVFGRFECAKEAKELLKTAGKKG